MITRIHSVWSSTHRKSKISKRFVVCRAGPRLYGAHSMVSIVHIRLFSVKSDTILKKLEMIIVSPVNESYDCAYLVRWQKCAVFYSSSLDKYTFFFFYLQTNVTFF